MVAADIVKTAGDPAKIELTADRSVINADGKDLSYITVKIKDRKGTLVPNADNLINFDLKGEGRISALPTATRSASNQQGKARCAFSGMCQVVIQSTNNNGKIFLKASSLGLPDEMTEISSN